MRFTPPTNIADRRKIIPVLIAATTLLSRLVYVRITDKSLLYYHVYDPYEKETMVRSDSVSRRQAIETLEDQ